MIGIIGRKVGMTRIYDEKGEASPVSVIEAGPCYVTQIKTQANDGYNSIQLGFSETRKKLVTKPLLGHLEKAKVKPVKVLKEFRDFDGLDQLALGDEIRADKFSIGDKVDVVGTSKGKGFAGVIKRHHFGGGPVTHGQSDRTRAPGSLGQSSYPSRVYKGIRMAGRMGGHPVTTKNLKILKIDLVNNLILIKGAIPGPMNGIIFIKK
jgi:large subunit ribosomal protein L3